MCLTRLHASPLSAEAWRETRSEKEPPICFAQAIMQERPSHPVTEIVPVHRSCGRRVTRRRESPAL